jgi:c-di-AMP phosphodiesterase-like protein
MAAGTWWLLEDRLTRNVRGGRSSGDIGLKVIEDYADGGGHGAAIAAAAVKEADHLVGRIEEDGA